MRTISLILSCTIVVAAVRSLTAGDSCCEVECPRCDHVCKLSIEDDKDKHHCWKVECKPICIPRVTFPWEKCCKPKCADIKYVRVLKKVEYECPSCKYVWTPVLPACCDACKCDSAVVVPLKDSTVPPPPAPTASRSAWTPPFAELFKR